LNICYLAPTHELPKDFALIKDLTNKLLELEKPDESK
jgi:hypothetical protein